MLSDLKHLSFAENSKRQKIPSLTGSKVCVVANNTTFYHLYNSYDFYYHF